jgi:hypothetical protein
VGVAEGCVGVGIAVAVGGRAVTVALVTVAAGVSEAGGTLVAVKVAGTGVAVGPDVAVGLGVKEKTGVKERANAAWVGSGSSALASESRLY